MAAKKAVNISMDVELAAEAKAEGMNISAILDAALRKQLSEVRAKKWRQENREALEAGNRELEKNGPWYVPDWVSE